jgi:hypothetical protein
MGLKYLYVPSGVKAGKAYAVLPEIINTEELTNGNFEQGSTGWTLAGVQNANNYADFSNGKLVLRNDGSSSGVSQDILTSGKSYDVELYVSDIVGNGFKVNVGAGINYEITTTGRIRFTIKATSSIFYLYRNEENPQAVNGGTIESVSVRETGADFSSFSRSSAGSRVDKNGFINTGLGLGSEEIVNGSFDADSNWTKGTGWAIANGVATYDGTGGSSFILQNLSIPINTLYEVKITVLSNEGTGINIIEIGNHRINNDHLDAGTYTFYFTSTSGTNFFLIYGRSGEELVIDNVSVREVTEVNTNVPRLDYTDGGCPSLLLEPQSTNLIQYSEDFSQSSWAKSNILVGSLSSISPQGLYNAFNIKGNSTSNVGKYVYDDSTSSTSTTYTLSGFFKKKTHDFASLLMNQRTSGLGYIGQLALNIDLVNGVVNTESFATAPTLVDSDIKYYGNGWYNVSLTATTASNGAVIRSCFGLAGDLNNFEYAGSLSDEIYAWGIELKQGSYATSYIPTFGTASTRAADVGNSTGDLSNVINSSEGVLYAEISGLSDTININEAISIQSASALNRLYIYRSGVENKYGFAVFSDGNLQCNIKSGLVDFSENVKISAKYKANDFALWVNGSQVDTDNNGNTPIGLSEVSLDGGNSSNEFYGKVKEIRVYDEALSDTELQELTTL